MFLQFATANSLEEKARLFAALGDPTTLKILQILIKNQMICVSDIAAKTENSISCVSHQLRKLRDLGLVKSERKGREICYFLSDRKEFSLLQKIL